MEYYDNKNKQNGQNSGSSQGPIYKPSQTPKCRPEKSPAATASLVCGISGCLCLLGFQFPIAIFLGVAAISLALLSRKGGVFASAAIAGLICGGISLVLGFGEFIYIVFLNNMLRDPEMAKLFDQLLEQYGYSLTQ